MRRNFIGFRLTTPTSEKKRERSDKIQKSVLKLLGKELKVCSSVRKYANKFIAYASDPLTNPKLTEKEKKITLDKFDDCYRAIINVSSFIASILLYECTIGDVPVPQYDQLENIDLPMVAKTDKDKLYSFWDERCHEVKDWNDNLWSKLEANKTN